MRNITENLRKYYESVTVPDPKFVTVPDPKFNTVPDPKFNTVPDPKVSSLTFTIHFGTVFQHHHAILMVDAEAIHHDDQDIH